MKQISVMLKPASSACNLRCKYCFYADLAGKRDTFCLGTMSENTVDRILENLHRSMEPGSRITIAFQGGEPTLVGLDWYIRFIRKAQTVLKQYHVEYALQTNGTLLDAEWAEFLHKYSFLVGLSIDGSARYHNSCRIDIKGRSTYSQLMNAVSLLREYRVEFNVLCTLTSEISRHPNQMWKWIRENDFHFVQFTPCMDALDMPGENPYALQPERFASFYIRIFELWLQDYRQGKYRSIKLFDDLVNLLAYGIPTACGIYGQCQCQLVVEADGSTYPCDFYCLDSWRLGNLQEEDPFQMIGSQTARAFLNRPRDDEAACASCRYRSFCGGGCRRMQREVYCLPGEKYCGYREFLDYAMPALQCIAMEQRNCRR